jgi:hypothetical protein
MLKELQPVKFQSLDGKTILTVNLPFWPHPNGPYTSFLSLHEDKIFLLH